MRIQGNTIVITGGGSGIGLAMAKAFLEAGNTVIICGRRESLLKDVQRISPKLHIRVCDVSVRAQREALFASITAEFPDVNILINNAGVQKETDFTKGAPELYDGESEIEINLVGCVHLCALFVPHFHSIRRNCAVINITSGLAFVPLKIVPVYCATKAALHSFSMSLRSQLSGTNIKLFEIVPPIVKTELHRGAKARKQAERGIEPERVASEALDAIAKDKFEKAVGQGRDLMIAARIAPHFVHRLLNKIGD